MKKHSFSNKNACLITDEITGKHIMGTSLNEGYLILADENTCFVDARYFFGVNKTLESLGIKAKLYSSIEDIKTFLQSIGTENLNIDFSKTTVKDYNEYKKFGFSIIDCEDIIKDIRQVKETGEIESTIKACEIAQKALYKGLEQVRLGMTESELRDIIERYVLEFGGQGTSFETIVAFSKNGAVPHHKTGNTKLENDMPILIDMGARFNGYCSDITRTVFFGTPTEEFKACYDAVLKANELAEQSIKVGITTDVADGFARNYLKEKGLDKYFTHSLGHGIGLEIHEHPTLSYKKKDQLKENLLFTIEPGVYLDGKFGIRIEDTVLLTKDGIKRLFTDSKELKIIKNIN